MTLPHGPHRIAANGQVVLPKEVLVASGLQPGDAVYVQAVETEGTVLIVPAETAAEWFETGRKEAGKVGSSGS